MGFFDEVAEDWEKKQAAAKPKKQPSRKTGSTKKTKAAPEVLKGPELKITKRSAVKQLVLQYIMTSPSVTKSQIVSYVRLKTHAKQTTVRKIVDEILEGMKSDGTIEETKAGRGHRYSIKRESEVEEPEEEPAEEEDDDDDDLLSLDDADDELLSLDEEDAPEGVLPKEAEVAIKKAKKQAEAWEKARDAVAASQELGIEEGESVDFEKFMAILEDEGTKLFVDELHDRSDEGITASELSKIIYEQVRDEIRAGGGHIKGGTAKEVKDWVAKTWLPQLYEEKKISYYNRRYFYGGTDAPPSKRTVPAALERKPLKISQPGKISAPEPEESEEEDAEEEQTISEEDRKVLEFLNDEQLQEMVDDAEEETHVLEAAENILAGRKLVGKSKAAEPEDEPDDDDDDLSLDDDDEDDDGDVDRGEDDDDEDGGLRVDPEEFQVEEEIVDILKSDKDKTFSLGAILDIFVEKTGMDSVLSRRIILEYLPVLVRQGFVTKGIRDYSYARDYDAGVEEQERLDLNNFIGDVKKYLDNDDMDSLVIREQQLEKMLENLMEGRKDLDDAIVDEYEEVAALDVIPVREITEAQMEKIEEIKGSLYMLESKRDDTNGTIDDLQKSLTQVKTMIVDRSHKIQKDLAAIREYEATEGLNDYQKELLGKLVRAQSIWITRRTELESEAALDQLQKYYGEKEAGPWLLEETNKLIDQIGDPPANLNTALLDDQTFKSLNLKAIRLRNLMLALRAYKPKNESESDELIKLLSEITAGIEVGALPEQYADGKFKAQGERLDLEDLVAYSRRHMPKRWGQFGPEDEIPDTMKQDFARIRQAIINGEIGTRTAGITPNQLINTFKNKVKGIHYYDRIFGHQPRLLGYFKRSDLMDPDLKNTMRLMAVRLAGEELADFQVTEWVEDGMVPAGFVTVQERMDYNQKQAMKADPKLIKEVWSIIDDEHADKAAILQSLHEMMDDINLAMMQAHGPEEERLEKHKQIVKAGFEAVERSRTDHSTDRLDKIKETIVDGGQKLLGRTEWDRLQELDGLENLRIKIGKREAIQLTPRDIVAYWTQSINDRRKEFANRRIRYLNESKINGLEAKKAIHVERREGLTKTAKGMETREINKLDKEIEQLRGWPKTKIDELQETNKDLTQRITDMTEQKKLQFGDTPASTTAPTKGGKKGKLAWHQAQQLRADIKLLREQKRQNTSEIKHLKEVGKLPVEEMPPLMNMLPNLEELAKPLKKSGKPAEEDVKRFAVATIMTMAAEQGRYNQINSMAESLHKANVLQLRDIRNNQAQGMEDDERKEYLKAAKKVIQIYENVDDILEAEVPETMADEFVEITHFPLMPRQTPGTKEGQALSLARFLSHGITKGEVDDWSAQTLIQFIGDDWSMCALGEEEKAVQWQNLLERSANDREVWAWSIIQQHINEGNIKEGDLKTDPAGTLLMLPQEDVADMMKWMGEKGLPAQAKKYLAAKNPEKRRQIIEGEGEAETARFINRFTDSPFFMAMKIKPFLQTCAIDKVRTIQGRTLDERDPEAIKAALEAAMPDIETADLQKRIEELERERNRAERDLVLATKEIGKTKDVSAEVKEYEQLLVNAAEKYQEAEAELEACEQENADLQKKLKARGKRQAAAQEVSEAAEQLAEAEPQLKELQQKIKAKDKQLRDLRKKVKAEQGACLNRTAMNTMVDSIMVRRAKNADQLSKYESLAEEADEMDLGELGYDKDLGALERQKQKLDDLITMINEQGLDAFVCATED